MKTSKPYPVVFFAYKRPDTTQQFLDLFQGSGAKVIYVFSDGPLREEDSEEVAKVRRTIDDFAKEFPSMTIHRHYAKKNFGLKKNIIAGLTKVFAEVDAAIIIEDDCLPHPDFFAFCSEMLTKYEDDDRVMAVNGTSVGGGSDYSYDFTRYPQCWGWATWARAWKLYDPNLTVVDSDEWHDMKREIWSDPVARWYWDSMLHLVKWGQVKTWDFQWSMTLLTHGGYAISPHTNLITNIGFGESATNTKTKTPVANLATHALSWPLRHPADVEENSNVTRRSEQLFYTNMVAILGMLRQYFLYRVRNNENRM
jgi:hypothetical protein